MFEEQAVQLIGTLGFPIVVCLWFMFRTEKIISANTAALSEFTAELKRSRLQK